MVRRLILRYEVSFSLPQTLAVHDWHIEGIIRHDFYAEIRGLETVVTSTHSIFNRSRFPALGEKRSRPVPYDLATEFALVTTIK